MTMSSRTTIRAQFLVCQMQTFRYAMKRRTRSSIATATTVAIVPGERPISITKVGIPSAMLAHNRRTASSRRCGGGGRRGSTSATSDSGGA